MTPLLQTLQPTSTAFSVSDARSAFHSRFPQSGMPEGEPLVFFAPGRVNLIGEHLDYNGGHVLPAAVHLGITAWVWPREDGRIRLASISFERGSEYQVVNLSDARPEKAWLDYPVGMLRHFKLNGLEIKGFDVLFSSTLPMGAGLSSSAAMEVLTGFIVQRLAGVQEPDRVELARFSEISENHFVGVGCGILDPFAIACCQPGQALLLNCTTLDYRHIPADFGPFSLVIMDTCSPRKLTDGHLNERRARCEEALTELRKRFPIHHLAQATLEQVETLEEGTLKECATHIVTEDARVLKAAEALESGNLAELGMLMNASHASLRDYYRVTGPALDTMVAAAWAHPACLGARMSGAGFGGCAIALVRKDAVQDFFAEVGQRYTSVMQIEPRFFEVAVSGGVRAVEG